MIMAEWKTFSIEQIEAYYDQSKFAPNMAEVHAWYAAQSQHVRNNRQGVRFNYGNGKNEYGYWFKPPVENQGIVVFIHGGAWRAGVAEDYVFPAGWLCDYGLNYVSLNFDNAIETGGALYPLLSQLTKAICWIVDHCAAFEAQPDLHVVSHSSGSHLAACLGTLDWSALSGKKAPFIQQIVLCSGIYDLEPVRYSKRRDYLALSDVETFALSPLKHAFNKAIKVSMAYGENESPEFVRQHHEFADKLRREGVLTHALMGSSLNHFEILQTFDSPDNLLGQLLLEGAGLAKD